MNKGWDNLFHDEHGKSLYVTPGELPSRLVCVTGARRGHHTAQELYDRVARYGDVWLASICDVHPLVSRANVECSGKCYFLFYDIRAAAKCVAQLQHNSASLRAHYELDNRNARFDSHYPDTRTLSTSFNADAIFCNGLSTAARALLDSQLRTAALFARFGDVRFVICLERHNAIVGFYDTRAVLRVLAEKTIPLQADGPPNDVVVVFPGKENGLPMESRGVERHQARLSLPTHPPPHPAHPHHPPHVRSNNKRAHSSSNDGHEEDDNKHKLAEALNENKQLMEALKQQQEMQKTLLQQFSQAMARQSGIEDFIPLSSSSSFSVKKPRIDEGVNNDGAANSK